MRLRSLNGKFALSVLSLMISATSVHAETHSGGVGPDGRPIAPGNSEAKLFQLISACVAGRPVAGGAVAAPVAASAAVAGPLPAGDLNRGNTVFQARCLTCHGPGGKQASLSALGDSAIARVMGGGMPKKKSASEPDLTPQERADVIAFIQDQQVRRGQPPAL